MDDQAKTMQKFTRENESMFDAGYREGVRDAVEYLADLFDGIYDTQVFEMLEVDR